MKLSKAFGYALLGTCLYGAVANSFLTDEEKDAVGEIDATNEVERAGCAAALGLKTTLGLTQGEIVAAIRGDQRGGGALASSDVEDSDLLLRRRGASSPQEITGLDARTQWGIRGAWDDDYYQVFGTDWAFPFGTNHLSGVVVYSQGGLAASSYDEPFVSLPIPVAIVPREGSFTVEQTASNSYIFAWWNVRSGRTATETLDAQIELFRNGDFCVSTNGVVVERYIRGNPYPDVPIGQDDDYRVWVDEQVGVGLTNGLYKFTASFQDDPIEATLLTVGEESVVVTNAGEYVFLLEKGREYEFETIPYDPTVEYDMCDDIAPLSRMRLMGWWEDDSSSAEWSIGGGENWLNYPGMYWWGYTPGWCCWMPTLQGSPGFTHLGPDDFPITLEAILTDFCGSETPSFQWSGSNDNVTFSNPNAQTTELNCDSLPIWDSLTLSVEANLGGYSLWSYLYPRYDDSRPHVSFGVSIPKVMFANNDDDDNDGVADYISVPLGDGDDDIGVGRITLRSDIATNATVQIHSISGFDAGFSGVSDFVFRDRACTQPIREGDTFTIWEQTEWTQNLYINSPMHSSGYEDVRIVAKLSLEGGEERLVTAKATIVSPIVAPICNEPVELEDDGEIIKSYMNPVGVSVGKLARFRIDVQPDSFLDSEIVWESLGGLSFVGSNRGRTVTVRGTEVGSTFLRVRLRDEPRQMPEFAVQVTQLRTIPIRAMIIESNGNIPQTESGIREMVRVANEVYSQVGMQFVLASVCTTNVEDAVNIDRSGHTHSRYNHSEITSWLPTGEGIECYFVGGILGREGIPGDIRGLTSSMGIALASCATSKTLAHEIGHLCGARDVYPTGDGVSLLSDSINSQRVPLDWNNGCRGHGTAGVRYYRPSTKMSSIVESLLMCGESRENDSRADMSAGPVYGILRADDDAPEETDRKEQAFVGFLGVDGFRVPICD